MLQKLNERIQGVIAWVVIGLIAVTFTLFGVDYYLQSHQSSNAAVEVNDEPITRQALEINYRRARQQRDATELSAELEKRLKNQVQEEMVVNLVTMQSARQSGFEVSPDEINAAILGIPQFQEDGHFSTEKYKQALSSSMFTPETFFDQVKQGMLLNQQRFAFIGTSFALPTEIKRFVKLYMQNRDYDYIEVPYQPFLDTALVSDSTIEAYYKANQKTFLTEEKVKINYVRLSIDQVKDRIKVTDADVKRFYDENQSNFLTPAKWHVAHILFAYPANATTEQQAAVKREADEAYQALQNNPSQFSQWVKTMSDDKLSIPKDGLLPWLSAGQSDYDKVLSEMVKPGQISKPVKSKNGYEVFKLVAFKPAVLKPELEVKDDIRAQLMMDMAQSNYAKAMEQLSDLSFESPDSLEPVAKALNLTIENAAPFSRQGGSTALTQNKPIINAAFSHDVLELGNNSEPLQVDNDSVVVLRVAEHFPSIQKPLSEVKPSIKEVLKKQFAIKAAEKLGQSLLSDEKKGTLTTAILETHHLDWAPVKKATRDNTTVDPLINDLAFSLASKKSVEGRPLMNGDYTIVRLNQINEGQYKSLDKEQRESITQQIEASLGVMDYDIYVNSMVKKAVVLKHPS
jgi:peptidyl-prolyl cis-trans isomerase D